MTNRAGYMSVFPRALDFSRFLVVSRILSLVAGSLALAGCASIRVDHEGRRHVIGLVWMELPARCQFDAGAETVRARSLGLTIANSPAQDTFVFGYSDIELGVIRNDAWVLLHAPDAKPESTLGVEPR